MKKIIITSLVVGIWSLVITLSAVAVPAYVNYQGVLRNSAGDLQTGTFNMTFGIYNSLTSITSLYTQDQSVSVSNGVYSVALGAIPNPETIFDGDPKYLEVIVNTETLSPRLKINTVAYAIRADVAGTAATATHATSADSATSAESASLVDGFSASSEATAGELLALDSEKKLTISGSSSSPIISGTNTSSGPGIKGTTSTGIGVSAEATGSGVALAIGGKITSSKVKTENLGAGVSSWVINDSDITDNSVIIFNVIRSSGTTITAPLVIRGITSGTSFEVGTSNASISANTFDFRYLIIN